MTGSPGLTFRFLSPYDGVFYPGRKGYASMRKICLKNDCYKEEFSNSKCLVHSRSRLCGADLKLSRCNDQNGAWYGDFLASRQLIKKGFSVLQIFRRETFGKPVVDRGK